MPDPLVALVVSVPEDLFPQEGGICLPTCNHICSRLESHLVKHGHSIPEWLRGGCEEDWGVCLESQRDGERFNYQIQFFDSPRGQSDGQMMVQYQLKIPFLQRLFQGSSELGADHHLHQTMREFGNSFSSSRMLTNSQFESEY
jgi:hypothetical protein